ncbi:MAG: DNA helicase PcrA [Acidaminococcus sp.]|jgi:DNA helicase-2/ATP-dependent DNA helicase PcrA|nr:DNA helicase PcrA [Acidaminococcus sp.]MCI2100577.1 DNA helicase PcrA [Acidaminococcus sp.]MCI2114878.1 DNA helicase PcrA [Acidaminococcus sp.]MCI2117000.1 DNA helicase PcrA [Acidaminococcus sp.]
MEDLLASLNEQQAKAVKQIAGPLLILAGAGSGKTKVLTTRIAYLLQHGVAPYNILAITFTNKAAKEMRQRVDALVGPAAKDVWLYTFHGFCNQVLRREVKHLSPYSSGFSIYDTTDCKNVLKESLKALNLDEKFYPINSLMSTISNAKNARIDANQFERLADDFHQKKVAEVYQEYTKRLVASNAVDFDDLLLLTVNLLQRDKEVREKYQQRFHYVMIDEYQDTNHVQYMLAKLLSAPENNLCAVGDIDQSIYGWRGADISNILDFEKDYPNARIFKLEQNYRSTQVILDAANEVIKHNSARRPKNLWTDNGNGKPIVYFQAFNDRNEADFVVHNIRSLRGEGFKYGDMAVLYRTNAQSRMFEETLIKNGVPYIMVGSLKFYDRKEIKDTLSYLRVLVNGHDIQAMERIINEPKRGIGAASVVKLKGFLSQTPLTLGEIVANPAVQPVLGRAYGKITAFSQMMDELRAKKDVLSVKELMDEVLKKTGYLEALETENSEQSKGRIENLQELMRIADEFVNDDSDETSKTLEDFLNHVALVSDIDDAKLSQDSVTLMTLHSAKGLEFPVVFMAGMEEGLFPSQRSLDDDEKLEEERRLCYVGITRAKKRLFLTSCRSRMVYGRTVMYPPSRFLQEIPRNLIENAVPTTHSSYEGQSRWGGGESVHRDRFQSGLRNIVQRRSGGILGNPPPKRGGFVPEGDAPTDFVPGDKVRHKAWGVGTIISAKPDPDGQVVKVAFPGAGIKTILTKYKVLQKA